MGVDLLFLKASIESENLVVCQCMYEVGTYSEEQIEGKSLSSQNTHDLSESSFVTFFRQKKIRSNLFNLWDLRPYSKSSKTV